MTGPVLDSLLSNLARACPVLPDRVGPLPIVRSGTELLVLLSEVKVRFQQRARDLGRRRSVAQAAS